MAKLMNIFIVWFIISQNPCAAQFYKKADSLNQICDAAVSDSDKVIALGKLAQFYITYQMENQGDSVLQEQLHIAELSDNKDLVFATLFGDAITSVTRLTGKENYNRTITFIQKGIDYARSKNQYDYIALGYSRMANILRKRGENDKALYNANLGLSFLPNTMSDSIKAVVYIELGDSYMAKGDALNAFTNYNNGFDIGLKSGNITIQSMAYYRFASLYRNLGKDDEAKVQLLKSLDLNKQHQNNKGLVKDYIELSKLTEEKEYIQRAISLAKALHLDNDLLQAKRIMLAFYEVKEKNSRLALHYLETEPDLKQTYINLSTAHYNWVKGSIYHYSNNIDSALYYLKLAEPELVSNFGISTAKDFLYELAQCYELKKDIPKAIEYYEKAIGLSGQIGDPTSIAYISESLSSLYEQQGNYKTSLAYARQATNYRDSLSNLSKERDIALLDVDREKRRHEAELIAENERQVRSRNLQYIAITIAITAVFILMLIIGMFPVSKVTIKMLSFFAFICLFEFIVLVIDNTVLSFTHGQPLKLWLIKIFLIACLVPLQHSLEHGLTKFLASRKLLEARNKFSLKKWMRSSAKPVPVKDEDFEEDTAVL
jgi:tetratricopeptide (TPR) repeat protein